MPPLNSTSSFSENPYMVLLFPSGSPVMREPAVTSAHTDVCTVQQTMYPLIQVPSSSMPYATIMGSNGVAPSKSTEQYTNTTATTTTTTATDSNSTVSQMEALALQGRMDLVWHGQFNACFGTYGHMWTLLPVSDITPTGDWNMFQDSAKIRFICSDCNNCWTSMKGRVQFWFYLLSTGEGFVYFQLFGQRCKKCKSEKFQNAIWYPEEVTKVINNVYHKVGQMYYGMHEQLATIRHERRAGKPRERHDSDLCQACSQGKCREASLACS